jgi:hypothetical protein
MIAYSARLLGRAEQSCFIAINPRRIAIDTTLELHRTQ